MIVAAVLSLMATVVLFNTSLRPYLLDKARAVAETVQLDIAYAMEIGIPFDKIRGLDAHIATLVAEPPEVADLRVVIGDSADGQTQPPAAEPAPLGPRYSGRRS